MPVKDIYEQRSMEVQSVLNRPPGKIIVWGNLVLVTVIGLFLYLSDLIKIQKRYSGTYSMENQSVKPDSIIMLSTDLSRDIFLKEKLPLKARLSAIGAPDDTVTCEIVSFKTVKNKVYLYVRFFNIGEENAGQIVVEAGSETLLTNIYNGIVKNSIKRPL
ncbi:hypothetical protein [Chitinophaga silvisoli]|uniref:Uncharacterized protein n=1 Tax=Chitinophaga silvisoli TaxID=2291814 RepID=A0A3E1NX53_9BACT|nr:hypothetical protein [Chitinophaga silvisoli]RFM32424.1 hypothetical protein DXN04_22320 [Chitinophaga silvisoli]